jgi:hypothetical protein
MLVVTIAMSQIEKYCINFIQTTTSVKRAEMDTIPVEVIMHWEGSPA